MKYCIDYQPAIAQRAGIGRYTRVLAEYLGRNIGEDDELVLFGLNFKRAPIQDVPGARHKSFTLLPGRAVQRLWRHLRFPPFDLLAGKADLYHFTNFIMPPLRRGKGVVTIYDMSFERFPEFAEERNLRFLRAGIRDTVKRADSIITISRFSADEIESCFPEAKGKTRAIPLGISGDFRRAGKAEVEELKRQLGIERPYFLTVGTIEPRKNLPFFANVFELLPELDMDWVVAGMPGWKCDPIFERLKNSPRARNIKYVQYVPDGKLAALYSGAELFVLPSRYEGFGFPPVEAMACGTPVVSSDGGSLPEILGDGARIVKGYNSEEWADAIRLVLLDSGLRERMVKAGYDRSASYTWERTARETFGVYREALSMQ